MSRTELIELLARVSLNVDEEIRMMAQQTMVNLIIESPAYRQRTIQGRFGSDVVILIVYENQCHFVFFL